MFLIRSEVLHFECLLLTSKVVSSFLIRRKDKSYILSVLLTSQVCKYVSDKV